MQQDAAETLALKALAWLAVNDELLPVFLGATGASLADLAARAGEAQFLGSVLDFVLQDDACVLGFAAAAGERPEALADARRALPGGEAVHWT